MHGADLTLRCSYILHLTFILLFYKYLIELIEMGPRMTLPPTPHFTYNLSFKGSGLQRDVVYLG